MMNQQKSQHHSYQQPIHQNQPSLPQKTNQIQRQSYRSQDKEAECFHIRLNEQESAQMNERASIKIKYKDYAQQRVGGFNSDNFQIESSQDNYILSDGDERPPMQQMMEQLESSKSTKALGRVRNLNSAHPDLGRQNSELQQIISKTPHHEVNQKQSRLNKLPSQEKHHHQE